MKKGKVLIVGGSGVIGNAALEQFVSSEWETISISRRLPECLSGRFSTYIFRFKEILKNVRKYSQK